MIKSVLRQWISIVVEFKIANNIDDLEKKEVVGTIAGYDTILVISKNDEDAKSMNDLFNKYLKIGRS